MSEFKEIIYEKRDGIAKITLNRPEKLNALTDVMGAELRTAFVDVQGDDNTRVLIITGNGTGFCSGEDVNILRAHAQEREARATATAAIKPIPRPFGASPLPREMERLVRKPIVAAVNGVAAGAGYGVALASDCRICSSNARFAHVYGRRALVTSCEVWYLPRLIGLGPAMYHILLADDMYPEEALRLGLVSKVVPPEALQDEAWELAGRLAERPLMSSQFTKEAIHFGLNHNLEDTMDWVGWARAVNAASGESREGTTSFLEKRRPQFR